MPFQPNTYRIPAAIKPMAAYKTRQPLVLAQREQVAVTVVEPPKVTKVEYSNVPPPKPDAWRVGEADFADFIKLAVPLLQERFPSANMESLVGWLRSTLGEPSLLLVRSKLGFGLFALERSFWYPNGFIEEKWTITPSEHLDNLDLLYREAVIWANSIGVKHLRFHPKKDIERIAAGFLAAESERCYEVNLEKLP